MASAIDAVGQLIRRIKNLDEPLNVEATVAAAMEGLEGEDLSDHLSMSPSNEELSS